MSIDSSQFLFREIEFEDDGFHAASFVAKYRRVTSLESLRDQLRHYCASLKNQLYEIINRDYKDFITIATKLDGVDDRVDHLRKPLIDLRCDLLNLHSGMVANMQAIQDKLDHRKEITDRKKVLESSLKCIEKLDTVEGIVTNIENKSSQLQYQSKRRHLLRAINVSLSMNINHIEASSAEYFPSSNIEVFEASELERASESLASAMTCLQDLQQYKIKSGNDSTITPAIISTSTFTLNKTLDLRVHKLLDILTILLRRKLTILLTPVATLNNNQMGDSPSNQLICCHLIRSFVALGKGKDVEDIFSEVVIFPLARGLLTPSRVDGTGGRGSFSGLHDTLQSIMSHLSVNFKDCFQCIESSFPSPLLFAHDPPPNNTINNNSTNSNSIILGHESNLLSIPGTELTTHKINPSNTAMNSDNIMDDNNAYNQLESMVYTPHPEIDLIVNGIWIPISNILLEKFSPMFSIGIATTFHRCYYAIYRFIEQLGSLISTEVQGNNDIKNDREIVLRMKLWIKKRLFDHPDIVAFNSKWGLELYFQLRRQEITSRIDHYYSMVMKQCIDYNIFSTLVNQESVTSSSSSSVSITYSIPLVTFMSLKNMIIDQMAGYKFHIPCLEIMCLECLVCLHDEVCLPAISDRFLNLLIQIMIRLEIFLGQWSGITTPHFTKEIMIKLSTLSSKATTTQPLKTPTTPINTTPANPNPITTANTTSSIKPVLSNGTVSTTYSTVTNSTTTASTTFPPLVTQTDLVSVLLDLHHILLWIKSFLIPYTQSKLTINSDNEITTKVTTTSTSTTTNDSNSNSIIGKVLLHQLDVWRSTVMSLWLKLLSLVEGECKHTLQAVRGIAGKYRMTNKPAPETMSTYVPSILQPIRDFQKKFPELLNVISQYYNLLQLEDTSSGTSVVPGTTATTTTVTTLAINQWQIDLIENVTAHYLQLVVTLMGTVRQMDTALQRRSNRSNLTSKSNKFSSTGSTTSSTANLVLTDSEKIQLQLLLDIRAYAVELESLGCQAAASKSYQGLLEEVAEASKSLGDI